MNAAVSASAAHQLLASGTEPSLAPQAATGAASLLWLVIALPLLGAAVILLARGRARTWGPYLAIGACGSAFAWALVVFAQLAGLPAEQRSLDNHLFTWIPVGSLNVDAGLLLDPLSATFILLITGVGTLIHIYSLGYMEHDDRRWLFFAYLNLFIAAMLLLVLGNGFLVLYVGWEGVGLASYLLISFWYYQEGAGTAAKKAFIMNRVGDAGLAIAIFIMFATVGTTSYEGVFAAAEQLPPGTVTAIGLLLLLGAVGKSGQFPLHTWLPDAMAGPTPVSALIHAATMVTAGVYLIARSTPLFDLSDTARLTVSIIGAITLLIGAIIGCAYDDIKKVLAYSTVSQIGYMFLAVGITGAGAVAILHLLTHGFFKAAMFLAAGSVMHGMKDQVDMRRFGALRGVMPITFGVMGVGYLAIIGIPPFSGFFSKDLVIESAFDLGGTRGVLLGGAALLGAGITAFYMSRLMIMTFFGKKRWTADVHPHESPAVMTGPMIVLGVGATLSGLLLTTNDVLFHWLEPVLPEAKVEHVIAPVVVSIITVGVSLLGVLAAVMLVGRKAVPHFPPVAVSPLTTAARNNLYFDSLNESLLMRPGQYLMRSLVWFDNRGIDGAVSAVAAGIGGGSGRLRRTQTGFVRSYALSIFAGAALVLGSLLLVRIGA